MNAPSRDLHNEILTLMIQQPTLDSRGVAEALGIPLRIVQIVRSSDAFKMLLMEMAPLWQSFLALDVQTQVETLQGIIVEDLVRRVTENPELVNAQMLLDILAGLKAVKAPIGETNTQGVSIQIGAGEAKVLVQARERHLEMSKNLQLPEKDDGGYRLLQVDDNSSTPTRADRQDLLEAPNGRDGSSSPD